jgi:hypothetical protein
MAEKPSAFLLFRLLLIIITCFDKIYHVDVCLYHANHNILFCLAHKREKSLQVELAVQVVSMNGLFEYAVFYNL